MGKHSETKGPFGVEMSSTNHEIEIDGDKYRLEHRSCRCCGDCNPAHLYVIEKVYGKEEHFGEVSNAARDLIELLIEKLKEHRGEEMKKICDAMGQTIQW